MKKLVILFAALGISGADICWGAGAPTDNGGAPARGAAAIQAPAPWAAPAANRARSVDPGRVCGYPSSPGLWGPRPRLWPMGLRAPPPPPPCGSVGPSGPRPRPGPSRPIGRPRLDPGGPCGYPGAPVNRR